MERPYIKIATLRVDQKRHKPVFIRHVGNIDMGSHRLRNCAGDGFAQAEKSCFSKDAGVVPNEWQAEKAFRRLLGIEQYGVRTGVGEKPAKNVVVWDDILHPVAFDGQERQVSLSQSGFEASRSRRPRKIEKGAVVQA